MALLQKLVNPFLDVEDEKKSETSGPEAKEEVLDSSSHCRVPDIDDDLRDDESTPEENEAMVQITNLANTVKVGLEKQESGKSGDDSVSNSSVSFGSVEVREYERVIDSTGIYMGLALGWNYNVKPATPVREKVKNKTAKYAGSASGAGSVVGGEELRMKRTNGSDRYGMLMRYGYERKEMNVATKEAARFYKLRQREAARSLVVKDERKKQGVQAPKKRLLRSMFG
eukprot:Nitzschia sp. Nitz4//scaffold31_size150131//115609//116289//NITZ4_002846-RA/size150131-processed-gene-0.143-mRNA-1//-1//CDS//3329547713//8971//frame0